jgi:hypothetical protein
VSLSTIFTSALRTTVPHEPGFTGNGVFANAKHIASTGPASVIPYPYNKPKKQNPPHNHYYFLHFANIKNYDNYIHSLYFEFGYYSFEPGLPVMFQGLNIGYGPTTSKVFPNIAIKKGHHFIWPRSTKLNG